MKAILFPYFISQIREKIRCYCHSGSKPLQSSSFLPARQRFILSSIGKSLILTVCLYLSMIHHLVLSFTSGSFLLSCFSKNRSYVHPILLVSRQSFNSSNPLFLKQNARLATSLASFARCSGRTIPFFIILGTRGSPSFEHPPLLVLFSFS